MAELMPSADRIEQKILFELSLAPMERCAPKGVEPRRVITREKLFEAVNGSFKAFESLSRPSLLRTVVSFGIARVLHAQEFRPATREEFDDMLCQLLGKSLITLNGEEVMVVDQH